MNLAFRIFMICGLTFASSTVVSAQIEFSIKGVEVSRGYSYWSPSSWFGFSTPSPMLKIEAEVKNTTNDTIPILRDNIQDKFSWSYTSGGKTIKRDMLVSEIDNRLFSAKTSLTPSESHVFNLSDIYLEAPDENYRQWLFDIVDSIEVEYHRYYEKREVYTAKVGDWDGVMVRGVPRGSDN